MGLKMRTWLEERHLLLSCSRRYDSLISADVLLEPFARFARFAYPRSHGLIHLPMTHQEASGQHSNLPSIQQALK